MALIIVNIINYNTVIIQAPVCCSTPNSEYNCVTSQWHFSLNSEVKVDIFLEKSCAGWWNVWLTFAFLYITRPTPPLSLPLQRQPRSPQTSCGLLYSVRGGFGALCQAVRLRQASLCPLGRTVQQLALPLSLSLTRWLALPLALLHFTFFFPSLSQTPQDTNRTLKQWKVYVNKTIL